MIEQLASRIKITFLLALFLSPVAVAAWSKGLDRWLEASHRYDPPQQIAPVPVEIAMND